MEANARSVLSNGEYGAAVRAALEAAPVSRREIAGLAGVSHTLLNKIVAGDGTTASTAKRVCDALFAARDARRSEAQRLREEALVIQKVALMTLGSRIVRRG